MQLSPDGIKQHNHAYDNLTFPCEMLLTDMINTTKHFAVDIHHIGFLYHN